MNSSTCRKKILQPLLAGILFSFYIAMPVIADDTDIFFSSSSSSEIRPNVLFVLDTSSSMTSTDGLSQTRLDRMKEALNTILDNATNINVGLMRYSGGSSGGPVLFPVSYIDDDVCDIEPCASTGNSVSVRVSQSSDDAEEDSTGAVVLTSTDLEMVDDPAIASGGETTFEVSVAVSGDDVEETSGGSLSTTSTDLEMLFDTSLQNGIGLRFQSVNVPKDATITYAAVEFTVDEPGSGSLTVNIKGDDVNDAAAFATSPANRKVTDRNTTSAVVEWPITDNPDVGSKHTTPDIKDIIQEIVSRGGWSAGNAMAILFTLKSGSTSNSSNRRIYEAKDGSAAPKLIVKYTEGASGISDTKQTIGLRFQDVQIPQGVTITNAYIEFEVDETSSETTDLTFWAENVDDAATFTTASTDITGRSLTTATAAWSNIEAWDTVDEKKNSVDLKSLVQEVVDRAGWCGGNDMAFVIKGTGKRVAKSYDGTSGDAPLLYVQFDPATIPTTGGCINTTITKRVATGSDDAEEKVSDGAMDLTSSDLEIVQEASTQLVGMRFQSLAIPQGATILSASLTFEIDENGTGTINVNIKGEDTDDAATFSTSASNISGRTTTAAAVAWNTSDNPAVDSSMQTPDLTSIVQEIVNRAGWQSGNDMAFIISNISGTDKRVMESYDGEASAAPLLRIQVQYNSGASSAGSTAVQTVRARLKQEVDNIEYKSGTPFVDAYYEAALYLRGNDVDYGKVRGLNASSTSRSEYTRVSHPASYTGGSLVQPTGCTNANLNAVECKTEQITGSPVYVSPISESCQTSHVVILSDGEPSSNSAASKVQTMAGISTCANSGNSACGPELSTYLYNNDQSSLSGTQNIKTYTIGFSSDITGNTTAVNYLTSIANNGGGSFYTANTSAELATAFNTIIAEILTTTSSFVAPGAAVNQFNRLVHDDEIYFSLFKPGSRPFWDGNVKKYKVDTTYGVIDANNVAAVDPPTGMFKDTALSFWSSSADGNNVDQGGAAFERSLTRETYTYVTGSSTTTLSHNDNALNESNTLITTTLLGLTATETTKRNNVLQWARGVDLKDFDEDSNTTEVRMQYADPLHSRPVIITYGGTSSSPDNTIYFGTNEGFIHAIDADDGSEVFNFIPEELLINLPTLFDNSTASDKPYGMDGPIVVWTNDTNGDNDYNDTGDHVYLYAGMRRGGMSYYALDVTDRTNPRFLWKITGGTGSFVEMGQSWSTPVLSKVVIGNNDPIKVLVIGGGYNEDQDTYTTRTVDSRGRSIYMVNATTGALVWEGSLSGADENFVDMNFSFPGEVRVIDINNDGLMDMMFAADMGGQVWRFDVANGASNAAQLVSGGVIADIGAYSSTTNNRRFYTTPDVALVKQGASKFLTISLGSGWRANPLNNVVVDRFYSIRDSYWGSAPPSYTKLTENDLVDVTNNVSASSVATAITAGKKGWYLTMTNSGEKVVSNSVTVNNQVIFSSYQPGTASSGCSAAQGTGRTYVVSVFDGTPVVNFDTIVSSDPNSLTKEDRVVTLKRGGIPPDPTVLFTPDPVVLIGPETPLGQLSFGDLTQRTYWYMED